jgi:hypothetical protein
VLLERALKQVTHIPVAPITNGVQTHAFGLGNILAGRLELPQLIEQARSPEHQPKRSKITVADHVVQLCLHTDRWGKRDLYHRWVLFDDRWAGTNRNLADAILRYARRWDVLTTGD